MIGKIKDENAMVTMKTIYLVKDLWIQKFGTLTTSSSAKVAIHLSAPIRNKWVTIIFFFIQNITSLYATLQKKFGNVKH